MNMKEMLEVLEKSKKARVMIGIHKVGPSTNGGMELDGRILFAKDEALTLRDVLNEWYPMEMFPRQWGYQDEACDGGGE